MTTPISLRLDNDLLAWIDQDIVRRGKASRQEWFADLAVAVRAQVKEQQNRKPFTPAPKGGKA